MKYYSENHGTMNNANIIILDLEKSKTNPSSRALFYDMTLHENILQKNTHLNLLHIFFIEGLNFQFDVLLLVMTNVLVKRVLWWLFCYS
jgi:hypothetical protein